MKQRAAATSLRRLCRTLLLPLLLLCVQHGAFLHGLSHYKQPAECQGEDCQQESPSHCALCLAYAGVESVARSASPPPLLLTGLSFALMAVMATTACAATAPAQRNRGPPVLR